MTALSLALRRSSRSAAAVCLLAACHFEVHDSPAECYDEYSDCIDDTGNRRICEEIKDACLSHYDERGPGGGAPPPSFEAPCPPATTGGPAGSDEDTTAGQETAPDRTTYGSRTGSGSEGDGPGDDAGTGGGHDGSTGEPEPEQACLTLHATCVAGATTLVEVRACETLFDQCIEAGPCGDECEPLCPDPAFAACLDAYAACSAEAKDEAGQTACMAGFDQCTTGLAEDTCVPAWDPWQLELCLDQHALCVECIEDVEELYVCRDVFDVCMQSPPAQE